MERTIEPQGGYGPANLCGECGRHHPDRPVHVKERERRRDLVKAAQSGAKIVAD